MIDEKKFNYEKEDIFGKYCNIPMYADGRKHIFKCIGTLISNTYMDVPVCPIHEMTMHNDLEPCVNVIHCGIDETEVIRVALKDIEIIEAQPKLDRWIPCSERMPEERDSCYVLGCGLDEEMIYGKASKVVNVTVEDEDGTRRVATSFTHKGKWEIETKTECFLNKLKVIAWMPLVEIEPYKG